MDIYTPPPNPATIEPSTVQVAPPVADASASKPDHYFGRVYRAPNGKWSWVIFDRHHEELIRGAGFRTHEDADIAMAEELHHYRSLDPVPDDANSDLPPIDPPFALPYRSPPDREGRFFEIQRLPSSAWRCLVKLSSGRTISWRDFGDTAEDFRRAWHWGNEWAS